MVTRRAALVAICWAGATPNIVSASSSSFTTLLDSTINRTPDLLTAPRGQREAAFVTQLVSEGRGPRPHYPKPDRSISTDAERLIVACEVTDSKRYAQKYERPVWPLGRSGVTIGIGYDVGYVDLAGLESDWGALLAPEMISALASACGVTGKGALGYISALHAKVIIPWETAQKQFHETTLPLYIAQTLDHNYLPGADKIKSADCLGALVSLVFNRGPSFKLQGDRYREMRAIRLHVVRGELEEIPGELRSMERIWRSDPNLKGLIVRRELEARLFEQGLKNTTA